MIQIVIVVALGTFMSALDGSIVNISLPAISSYFNITITTVEWVVLSYLIIISSLLLTFGRLGDLYGHKKIYIIGFAIFTLGSFLCALSSSIILLVIFRALQAVGAGMLMSMGPAIIILNAPANRRGRYLGIIGISVSIALSIGPVLGGFLTSIFGWQSIFLINIPIGVIAFIWALKVLPTAEQAEKHPFDFIGAIILFFALIGIIFPLSFIDKLGISNPLMIGSFVLGTCLLILFVFVELRIKHPMFDFSLFKSRVFLMGNISLLLNFIAQFMIILIIPFYLIQFRNFSASAAGLILIANPVIVLLVTPISGYLTDRYDTRYICSSGMILITTGLFLLGFLNENSNIASIILYLAIIGLGIGMFQTPNNYAIMCSVSQNRSGTASSMLATMRNLGMVLGASLSGSLFSYRQLYLTKILSLKGISGIELNNKIFTGAMKFTFIIGAILAFCAIFTSVIRSSDRQNK
ncbi:MAG: MFS transporter [Actinobacteria bacterium]|nr:MFS transporter [Actinomycetota bacterium]